MPGFSLRSHWAAEMLLQAPKPQTRQVNDPPSFAPVPILLVQNVPSETSFIFARNLTAGAANEVTSFTLRV